MVSKCICSAAAVGTQTHTHNAGIGAGVRVPLDFMPPKYLEECDAVRLEIVYACTYTHSLCAAAAAAQHNIYPAQEAEWRPPPPPSFRPVHSQIVYTERCDANTQTHACTQQAHKHIYTHAKLACAQPNGKA